MTPGQFIAFEGGEGTGKSTQAKMLASGLLERGYEVELTREPGGTPGAEAIRHMLLDPPGGSWDAEAEALLFAAARADHVARLIRPSLKAGRWVISDRFVDSSRAYQGGAGGLGDAVIQSLHRIGSDGLRPDLTILIEVDPAITARRVAQRDDGASDAIGGRSADYHASVARSFEEMALADPEGFVRIDGSGSADDVHRHVMRSVAPLLELDR